MSQSSDLLLIQSVPQSKEILSGPTKVSISMEFQSTTVLNHPLEILSVAETFQQALLNSFKNDTADFINMPDILLIQIFAVIAHTNSILVSQIYMDSNKIHILMMESCMMLQMIIDVITMMAELLQKDSNEQISAAASKRESATQQLKNQLNMHIELHYTDQTQEYEVVNNVNVLMGENKHHEYKSLIQKTNKQSVEKILLIQESFRQILFLTLHDVFAETEPTATICIQEIKSECPILIKNMLHTQSDDPDDNSEQQASIVDTCLHLASNMINQMWADENLQALGIPHSQLSKLSITHQFLKNLQNSYKQDWHIHSILKSDSDLINFFQKATFAFPTSTHQVVL
ncbi:hypothetical protein LOZ53_004475 [Ophidiomyces ophidiicola]|nr:hypothetical protein LOZ55_006839 [Ophidiomyces ophidiicola]KAI1987145.1 hypothetical protein LOZ53_004475 [Ophidiomyces ophidiicola]